MRRASFNARVAREVEAGACTQSGVCQSVAGIAVVEKNRCIWIIAEVGATAATFPSAKPGYMRLLKESVLLIWKTRKAAVSEEIASAECAAKALSGCRHHSNTEKRFQQLFLPDGIVPSIQKRWRSRKARLTVATAN